MNNWAFFTVITLFAATMARAGLLHPIEQTGYDAQAIQQTVTHQTVTVSKRMMPDRMISNAPATAPTKLPSEVKNIPQLKSNAAEALKGPIPKAGALPAEVRFGIPQVQLPHSMGGDGLLTMKPESLSLKGSNRAQIHNFLRHARDMKIPSREYTNEVRSREITQRYRSALSPTPYKSFRTSYSLSIAKVGKIMQPPPAQQYENMVKRIDSLFDGLSLSYPQAVLGLWELAESNSNAKNLQARDALFAGILGNRAGWEAPAALLLEESVSKRVEMEERYARILWAQLEEMQRNLHIDKVISKVNPQRVRELELVGDKANFAMAKRMQLEGHRAPLKVNPDSEIFISRIVGKTLRDRAHVLAYISKLRSKNPSERSQALESLRVLEAESTGEVQQEARLGLARGLLQKGASMEAMDLYKSITKNGKNRLEVLAEQTYAEYMSGEFQASLGKSVVLQSPYFQYGFAPDIHLVEILSRKAMCDFGGAEAGVQRFAERYGRELNALEARLAQRPNPEAFYEELVSYHDSEQPMRFQRYMLQLAPVMENQKAMNQALGDLKKLDNVGIKQKLIERPAGWDNFASSMRDRWSDRAKELRKNSAESALGEAAYMVRRLRATFAQVELLDLDISTSSAKNFNLQSALNFPAHKKAEELADIEKLRWPYEDEVWEDEIDFMRSKNPSKCAVAAR